MPKETQMTRREILGFTAVATTALLGVNGYSIYKDIARRMQQYDRAEKAVTERGRTPEDQQKLDYLTETNKERLDNLGWKARPTKERLPIYARELALDEVHRDAVSQELRRIRNQEGAPTLIEIGIKAGAEGLGVASIAATLAVGENPTEG